MRAYERLIAVLCGVCVALVFGVVGQAADETITIKLAHVHDVSHPIHEALQVLATRTAELSKNSVRVVLYPSGQLGGEREVLEKLQIGSVGMTKVGSSLLESFEPKFGIFSMPYLFRDDAHKWRVLGGEIGQRLLRSARKKRLLGLGYYEGGARSFYTKEAFVKTPADLKGMKVRVQKSRIMMEAMEALGASATPVSYDELYTALASGVVDAAENNIPSLYSSKHYEVCSYYTLDRHTRMPDVLLIGTKVWDKLSKTQQQALYKASQESVDFQRKQWGQKCKEYMAEMKAKGLKVFEPDTKPFEAAVQSLYKKYEDEIVGKLAKEIKATP